MRASGKRMRVGRTFWSLTPVRFAAAPNELSTRGPASNRHIALAKSGACPPAATFARPLLLLLPLPETPRDLLERTFKSMLAREDCGLLLINQPVADAIRPVVNAHKAIIPMVLEIPSKDVAYDPKKDPLMKRVLQMLGEDS